MFASINRPGWRVGADDTQGEGKLRTFNVLVDADDRRKAVKAGWSWPAFLFGSIWALFSGLWGIAIVMIPIEFILVLIANTVGQVIDRHQQIYDNQINAILLLVVSAPLLIRMVFGLFGNRWRLKKAMAGGYSLLDSVKASNPKAAISSCRSGAEPTNRIVESSESLPSSRMKLFPSPRHISSSAFGESDRSQVNDIAKLIIAFVITITLCILPAILGGVVGIVGCLPSLILLAGLAVSIISCNASFIEGTTKLVSTILWICFGLSVVLSVYMQYLITNIVSSETDLINHVVDIPISGTGIVWSTRPILGRYVFSALSLIFIIFISALRFLWLRPLLRQFDAICAISFGDIARRMLHRLDRQDEISGVRLRWAWTVSAAIIFFILLFRGHHAAAIFIAISGLIAAPSLAAPFYRYGGNEKLRTQICLGAAGLSCAAVLLFTAPSRSDAGADIRGMPNEPAVALANDAAVDNSSMPSQNAFNTNSQPTATPSYVSQSLTGCIAIDGDTLKCGLESIRLLGIDAPEMPGHCRIGRECVQGDPFASQASLQNSISYTMNIVRVGTDRYGRTLGLIYANGQNLSCIQLSRGQAAYIPDWDNGSRVASECSSGQF